MKWNHWRSGLGFDDGVLYLRLIVCSGRVYHSYIFQSCFIYIIYGTVSAKIALPLKCYKNASRLNRYNFPTDYAIDFLFSTIHREMV